VSKRRSEEDWTGAQPAEDLTLVEQIKTLAEVMAATQVTELELTENGIEITLRRNPLPMIPLTVTAAPAESHAISHVPAKPHAEPEAAADVSIAVMAPITGVFYIAPSPTSPPYAQPGDHVSAGQVVCIVEAMKVFNEIKTEIGGIVVAIPPKPGQLVKKGDPLVRIKPH
jgi:acetyl-CoA carboxylase biotin carboxyl carrier protein